MAAPDRIFGSMSALPHASPAKIMPADKTQEVTSVLVLQCHRLGWTAPTSHVIAASVFGYPLPLVFVRGELHHPSINKWLVEVLKLL